MKILVPIKRVIDPYVRIRVKRDESGVESQNVKMSMNPFCEIAVEEAVRLKENNPETDILAVSIGPAGCMETIRSALAIGADRGLHLVHEEELFPLTVALLLQKVVQEEEPDLIILGKQAIDGDNNQTGQMLAGLLGWPQGTFISSLTKLDGAVVVEREIDEGLEKLELDLPAVVTTDLRLNEPRYPKLPDIMKAKQKPVQSRQASELGVDLSSPLEIVKVSEPPSRQAGEILSNVDELIDRLRNRDKVLPS